MQHNTHTQTNMCVTMETLVLIPLTTNPQAHFTVYTVYTVYWSQTQGQEMTHRYPNTVGDTYCTHPLLKLR